MLRDLPTIGEAHLAGGRLTNGHLPGHASTPRVLLVSQRAVVDQIANAVLYDFEDLVRDLDQVDLLAPAQSAIVPGKAYKFARRCGAPRGLARQLAFRARTTPPAPEYELLLAIFDSYRQVATVHQIAQWRRRCHKAICFFPEIWPKDFIGRNDILELFDVFDHIYVGVSHCVQDLAAIVGRPCTNLHPAVDTIQFHPRPEIARCIDLCYVGRRSDAMHRRLLGFAADSDLFYYYDTAKGPLRFSDHRAHRRLFADLVKRSRYFIANYARIDRPDWTGGTQEVGYRFFEGAAGGTVMIGQPPANEAFGRLFPWQDAVIEVPLDAPDVVDRILELDADPERTARIRIANVAGSLRSHDWVYRYEEMLAGVGLEPTPAMVERRAYLQAMADRLEHTGFVETPEKVPA